MGKYILPIVVVVSAGLIAVAVVLTLRSANAPTVSDGNVSVAAAPGGTPSENVNAHADLIRATSPKPNDEISSPLVISGEARGTWFFEATFPIKLLDADGMAIAVGHASAGSDWMTTEFVPFGATFEFTAPSTATGTLVLEKDNPSGLAEHDDAIRIPVRFAKAAAVSANGCRKTGCSSQLCFDEDVVTTCEFRPEYACYRTATCARQADGKCGWTANAELSACLADPPKT